MVCAAMDHGGNRKHKIVERRRRQRRKSVTEAIVSSGNKKSERGAKMTVLARVWLRRAARLRAGT
jgi:hypothetical protein